MSQFTAQEQGLAESYEDEATYIFISYAHADSEKVLPMIERLQRDGFRVWYDESIVGNVDWVNDIADHVAHCHLFIAFMTKNYQHSENCLDELFFARDVCPERLLVYLDDEKVSNGIRMRCCRKQALYHWQCTNSPCRTEEAFYQALYRVHGINECRIQTEDAAQDVPSTESRAGDTDFEIVDKVLLAYHGVSTTVTIPAGVTKIGQGAFKGNRNLESVMFPETLSTVGFESFRDCVNLKTVLTNDSLVRIGQDAFSGCKSLQEIRLPASLKTLCGRAFYCCYALQQITVPPSVTKIDAWTFANCRALRLERIMIPASTEIAETAFRGCAPGVERLGQQVGV